MLRAWQRAEGSRGIPDGKVRAVGVSGAFRRHARPAWVLMLTFLRAHFARLVDVV